MANATAYISAEEIQSSQDWYAWFFDRESGYLQVNEDWYAWNFERAPVQTEATAEQGEILLQVSSVYELTGIEAQTEIGTVNAQVDETELITGQEATAEAGEVTASGSGLIAIAGIEATSETGKVTASGTGEMVMVPSRESYRKPKKSAVISIIGLDMASDVGKPVASGTIIINNVAKVFSIEARLEAGAVQAEGVLNLSDEEIILLMAA